jgi:hypothetical protein
MDSKEFTEDNIARAQAALAAHGDESFKDYVARILRKSGESRAKRRDVARSLFKRCRAASVPVEATAVAALQALGRAGGA